MTRSRAILSTLTCAAIAALSVCTGALAQSGMNRGYQPPAATTAPVPELKSVDIEEKNGSMLPLDTMLVDEQGVARPLRDILPRNRPAILQIGYMRCPMLCSLVMNALVRGLQGVDWNVGEEFDVISVSIDPREKHDLAAAKKLGYVAEYGRGSDGKGWHFLTGEADNVRAVADAVGFKYTLQPDGEYSHAAAIFIITPEGKLSRVLYGVKYDAPNIRMGLLEAGEGRIGSTIDRIILWCHVYNAEAGGYVLFAMRLMQLGGAVTVAILGGGLFWFWWRDHRRKFLAPHAGVAPVALAMHK